MEHNLPFREKFKRTLETRVQKVRGGCWLWTGSCATGYGVFMYKKRNVGAHRASWIYHVGDIPDGKFICHKCDVRNCINPKHLFLGDYKSNMTDRSAKGRHPNAQLTRAQAVEAFTSVESNAALARKFGVAGSVVSRVRMRQAYTWATEGLPAPPSRSRRLKYFNSWV